MLMITVPVVVHTRSLLLEITQVDGPRWVLEVYAIFFAVAFDCSIFMFALYKKREQAVAFSLISGIVGWLFWCSDLVFVQMQEDATGQEWARLMMGTLWAGFSAYLVFWCSEIVAETFSVDSFSVRGAYPPVAAPSRSKRRTQNAKRKTQNASTNQEKAMKLAQTGLSVKEIAEQLGVSIRTVRRYQSNGVG